MFLWNCLPLLFLYGPGQPQLAAKHNLGFGSWGGWPLSPATNLVTNTIFTSVGLKWSRHANKVSCTVRTRSFMTWAGQASRAGSGRGRKHALCILQARTMRLAAAALRNWWLSSPSLNFWSFLSPWRLQIWSLWILNSFFPFEETHVKQILGLRLKSR
jgi:hypothetical protein